MAKKDFDFIFKFLLICAVFLSAWNYIFFSFPKIAQAQISDDFDSYPIGPLISVPNKWFQGLGNYPEIRNEVFRGSSGKSLHFNENHGAINGTSSGSLSGKETFFIYVKNVIGADYIVFGFFSNNDPNIPKFQLNLVRYNTGWCLRVGSPGSGTCINSNQINFEEWAEIKIEWSFDLQQIFVNINDEFSGWKNASWSDNIMGLNISSAGLYNEFYVDDFFGGKEGNLPEVWGIDPASGSEIYDLHTNLKIGYQNLNFDEIDGLIISFINDYKINSGLNVILEKTNLDPSGSGIANMSLQSFYFDTKEKWNLQAFGFKTWGDIIKQNHIATDNLVFDPYFLYLTDETLKTPFTFTDPADWYALNVTRYASSTAFFSSFVGLISPVFETVGNFAVGIKDIFNTDQAYQTGYTFGAVLPLINGYIDRIDSFFGGFPLGTIFKYCIYVLIAMFIIRLIFKFIPFFG